MHTATLHSSTLSTAVAMPDRRTLPSPATLPPALSVRRFVPDAGVPAVPGRGRERGRDEPASAGLPSALHLRDYVRRNRTDLPSAVHDEHGNDGHAAARCTEPDLDRVSASMPPAPMHGGRGLPDVRLSGRPADPAATMPDVQRRQPVLPVPRSGDGLTNQHRQEDADMSDDDITRARLEPDTTERFVPLRRQLGVTSFGINQIVLEPGQRGRIHRHERQEEVYLVLAGTLTVAIEREETDLGEGELIRVAPPVRRQLVNRGPRRVVLLALGGEGEHSGRDGEAFASWEDTTGAPPQEIPLPADLTELRGSETPA